MPTVQLANSSGTLEAVRSELDRWFRSGGFEMAVFNKETMRVTTDRMGELIVFKLTRRPDHDTYYKEVHGGALIVFEIKVDEERVSYEGYCPLLIFGFWKKKLSFEQGAGGLFKYRDEGHRIEQKLLDHIRQL